MSKIGLMLTSLVAAIPGGFLAYLLVSAFLSHAESMTTMVQALAGGTLLVSSLLALMPFGVLIFGPKEDAAQQQAAQAPAETGTEDAEPGLIEEDEEPIDEDEDIVMAEDEGENVEFADDLSDDAVEIADVDSSDDIFTEEDDDALSDFDFEDEDDNKK